MEKFANYLLIKKENNIYSIHLTPELQDDIGTVGYLKFTDEKEVRKDELILVIEASKTIMTIKTPLQGTIIDKNTQAIANPILLNSSKFEENWIVKLTNVDEKAFLALEDY